MNKFLIKNKIIFLGGIASLLFSLTSYGAEIPYDINKVPKLYTDQYFISKPIGKECPIGQEQQAISNYSLIIIDGDNVMGVCLARKAQREQLEKNIEGAGASTLPPSKVTGKVEAYKSQVPIPCQPLAGGTCPSAETPAGYIARLYQFGLMIVGLLAFGGIIFGSLKYILSAGNVTSQQDAKDQITQAILGLILLLGAFLILYTINPDLVNLRNPKLEFIKIEKIIGEGQIDTGGEQRLFTSAGSGDPLCKLSVNANVNLSISGQARTGQEIGEVGQDISGAVGEVLGSGGQKTGSVCISCKDNAAKDANGVCQCNPDSVLTGDLTECVKIK